MIRQDEYEKRYAQSRVSLETAYTMSVQEFLNLFNLDDGMNARMWMTMSIHLRAFKDELASRFARESIHDVEGYDS